LAKGQTALQMVLVGRAAQTERLTAAAHMVVVARSALHPPVFTVAALVAPCVLFGA